MTTDPHSRSRPEDLAALYCAGGMDADERRAFLEHLSDGCPECARELASFEPAVEQLMDASAAVEPPSGVRERILRHAAAARDEAAPGNEAGEDGLQPWRRLESDVSPDGLYTLKQEDWRPTGVHGISYRKLFLDRERGRLTAMFRMEPGTEYPPHRHNQPEECLVLEGELIVDERLTMRAGDFQRADAGSTHGVQRTKTGCVLLISSGVDDEMLPATG